MHYRARLRPPWLLLVCIGLIALNMRGPIVAVAPVLGLMEADLHFSAVGLGLLTGIPVLCFAVASPLASRIGRRLGAEFAVTLTLFGVLMGTVVRSIGTGVPVVFGTALIGIAITVGNIAVPLIIRRDFSVHRQGTAMGVYTAALNVGSFVTSVATVPLALELGWRAALACGGLLAILGLLTWIVVVGRRRALVPAEQHVPMTDTTGSHGSPWITFGLTASFAAQGFSYYGITAWLPPS